MPSSDVLVFDVGGDYAHYRKFNTTTSPLTYHLPPRPALAGLLGAVLGVLRETAPGRFAADVTPVNELFHPDRCALAVRLLHPVRKTQMAFNLLDTKKSFYNVEQRTQIEFELLKDPKFRIYVALTDAALQQELTARLRDRNFHFTPYLGLAQLLGQVTYRGSFPAEVRSGGDAPVRIQSAVNLSRLGGDQPVRFEDNGFYSLDTFPNAMNRHRVVEDYAEILVERGGVGGPGLLVRTPEYVRVDETNLLFL